MPPIAVIGDIAGSRRADHRKKLGARVDAVLNSIAKDPTQRTRWGALPVRTKGIEEISAVAKSLAAVWPLIERTLLDLWPVRMRLAIAVGEIDVGKRSGNAAKMDGPAFHKAAEAMQRAKDEDLLVTFDLGSAKPTSCRELSERLLSLVDHTAGGWTPRMHEAVVLIRAGHRQADAAKKLQISQQAVSALLQRAGASAVFAALDATHDWLDAITLPRNAER